MSKHKSPFIYLDGLISLNLVLDLYDKVDPSIPDVNEQGQPIPSFLIDDDLSAILLPTIETVSKQACSYYGCEYKGIESIVFEIIPAKSQINTHSENSELLNGKWVKTKARDLTGIIFLSSHIDAKNVSSAEYYECVGGKLQFINYGFGFMPVAGDMVIYPSDARFANSSVNIIAGDLVQVRFHIATKTPYIHDISKFPGTYKDWF